MRVRTPLRIKVKQHFVRNAQAWLAVMFATIVGAASVAAASSYSQNVSVDRYQGQPIVLRDGFEIPVTIGMTLRRGDRIVTDNDSRLAIDMGPDSLLMVGSDSEIALTALHSSTANDGGVKAVVELPRGVARFMTPTASVERPRRIRMVLGEAKFRIGTKVTDAWFKHAEPTNVGCLFEGALEVFVENDKVADVGDPRFCFLHNLESEDLPVRVIDESQYRSLLAQTDIRPDSVVVASAPRREVTGVDENGLAVLPPIVPAKPALRKPTQTTKPNTIQPQEKKPIPPVRQVIEQPVEIAKVEPRKVVPPVVKRVPVKPKASVVRRVNVSKPRKVSPVVKPRRVVAKPITAKQKLSRQQVAKAAAEAFARSRGYELNKDRVKTASNNSVAIQPEYQVAQPKVAAIVTGTPPTYIDTDEPITTDKILSILDSQWRIDHQWDGEQSQVKQPVPKPVMTTPKMATKSPRAIVRKKVPNKVKRKTTDQTWHVNIASYGRRSLATKLAQQLQTLDVPAFVMSVNVKGKMYHRVYVQVVGEKSVAKRAGKALVGMFGIKSFWLKKQ